MPNWLCSLLKEGIHASTEQGLHLSINSSNISRDITQDTVLVSNAQGDFSFVTTRILIPCLCIFGLIGNMLNLLVLLKRVREGVDQMEKGAIIGMIALALSDFLFCLITICETFLLNEKMLFTGRNASFYFTLYGNFFQNILIKTSTWFTVIMAIGRHVAVCYPMQARQYMRPCHTSIAIIISFVFWVCLHIPLLWTWKTQAVYCPSEEVVLLIDVGVFIENAVMREVFTYIWALLGFFIPVFTLAYCNCRLIQSLHMSRKLRKKSTKRSGTTRNKSIDMQHRISITLVAIVVMFFFCVCPSEILHFYGDIVYKNQPFPYKTPMIICNLLQVLNFSSNFGLYCAVNSYFRKSLVKLCSCYIDMERKRIVFKNKKEDNTATASQSLMTYRTTIEHQAINRDSSCASLNYVTNENTL